MNRCKHGGVVRRGRVLRAPGLLHHRRPLVVRAAPHPSARVTRADRHALLLVHQPQRTLVPTVPEVQLNGVDLDGTRPTVFITHGFTGDSNATWMLHMKDALLHKGDMNVILTDWGPGAAGPLKYLQVAANTRVVGAEMARLVEHMIQKRNVDPQNVHLIGHSLGAHVSAYCGKKVKNIGKLTALDPAQPAFEGYDRAVRLDASDASFVEVVHTDAKPVIPLFGLGMITEHGDVDYYINGGFTQPGCLVPKNIPPIKTLVDFLQLPVQVIGNLVACPHGRSTLVYIEAIRQHNCTFWGHPGNFVENVVG
ncbi:Phospholipase A1 [Gryllus bimaculatus]|nr:Phospholipase A1 [Gryllus bimaculatus]